MADKKLKHLLEGLLSEVPVQALPEEVPQDASALRETGESVAKLERQAMRLRTASRVSRAASSILSLDELLPQVVHYIKEQFGLYYAGIFLVQQVTGAPGEWAVLQAGTGQAGRQMVERRHRLQVGGDSMIGWCIAHRRGRIALDVGADAVRFDNPLLPHTRSEVALPLISRDRAIGAMTFHSARPADFDEDDISVLQNMADQLANAIENARLFEDRERQIAQLSVVNEIGQAVSFAQDLDVLLETVYQQVSRLFDTTNFYIAIYEEASNEWVLSLAVEHGEREPVTRYQATAGLTGHILHTRQPVLLRTAAELEALHQKEGIELLGEQSRSWLGVPLLTAGRVVGVMAIQDYEHEYQYGDDDVRLFSTIAAQIAKALENVELLSATRQWAQNLNALHSLSLDLAQEQQDLDTLLDTITRRSMDLLHADGAGIWLWRERASELELAVSHQVGDTDFVGRRLKPGEGLPGRALAEGTIQTVDDYLPWSGHDSGREGAPPSAAMAVPLIWQNEIVAVLALTRSQPERPFVAGEEDLAQLLAGQAAAVIQNARLLGETRANAALLSIRIGQLDCLNDMGRKIDQVPPVPEFLAWVARRVLLAVQHADKCRVAVEFEGQIYGMPEALQLPTQMVESMFVWRGGQAAISRTAISSSRRKQRWTRRRCSTGSRVAWARSATNRRCWGLS
jgi:GAF domain-containing protein